MIKTSDNLYINPVLGKVFKKRKDGGLNIFGFKNAYGYIAFGIKRKVTLAHRYIFEKYHCIQLSPEDKSNHINWDKTDNCIENLECVTAQQNCQWTHGLQKRNTSGYKGVSWQESKQKWVAYITCNRKRYTIGRYHDILDAAEAYNMKATEFNETRGARFSLNVLPT